MKKIVFAILMVLGLGLNAQEAMKLMKEAKKEVGKYGANAVANTANLEKALSIIQQASALDAGKDAAKVMIMKGDIYNEIADAAVKATILKPDFKSPVANAASMAADAYVGASKVAVKGEMKDVLKGLSGLEVALFNAGIAEYQAQDMKASFVSFKKAIEVADILKGAGEKSRTDVAADKDELYYFTAVAGYQGGMKEEIVPIAEKMVANGTEKSFPYQVLFEILADSDATKAEKYLQEGRTKFPDDSGLLFAEINNALKLGKFEELVGKLKAALVKEPDNLSIYTTLGSVYEQLANKSLEAKDQAAADGHFAEAMGYYEQALAKSPESFDANYSIGAVYYNKAAKLATEVNQFASDYSAAGTKKYNEAKDKMVKAFEVALPYFTKAESLKANDNNTLIALKEIYARIGKLDKSKEYKEKLDAAGSKQ